jgi:hypothetical protein
LTFDEGQKGKANMIEFNTTGTAYSNEGDGNGTGNTVVAFAIFCGLVILLWICLVAVFSKRRVPTSEIATAAQQTTIEEDKKTRKEWISKVLVVREWSSDGATVETGTSDSNPIQEDGSERKPPATQGDVEAPCAMGSDECQYFVEEGAGCAICLSEFQDRQLVCESNNASCQHVFHKDCMIGWLTTKQHDDCPMCRETYLLKTV